MTRALPQAIKNRLATALGICQRLISRLNGLLQLRQEGWDVITLAGQKKDESQTAAGLSIPV